MDERPFPHGPLPQPPPSRRGFIVVGVLAAAAAGGGVLLARSSEDDGGAGTASPTVSRELRAAADAERALLATVGAALKHAQGTHRAALLTVRGDHLSHLKAIEAAIADALYPLAPTPAASASATTAAPPSAGRVRIAQVRTTEQHAASAAAARAARLSGNVAVLLASIAACEATHAELLSGVTA